MFVHVVVTTLLLFVAYGFVLINSPFGEPNNRGDDKEFLYLMMEFFMATVFILFVSLSTFPYGI